MSWGMLSTLMTLFGISHDVPCEPKHWAVLVAGSNGYFNYRHQADVAHAYQLLRENGIPAENIITMMYDDVADNQENPFKGHLYHDYTHKDVYQGVEIDYRGEDVTPDNFIAVLLGDEKLKQAKKKVLDSCSEDNVFIYFSDHGGAKLVTFPSGELFANQLNDALKAMYERKRYKKLVFYIEACHSGSMFEGYLPSDINVYAVTASDPAQKSYSTFCEDPEIIPCLADEFSYQWIMDAYQNVMSRKNLQDQYTDVKRLVKRSHVMQYGDTAVSKDHLFNYLAQRERTPRNESNDGLFTETFDSRPASQAHIIAMRRSLANSNSIDDETVKKRRLYRALELGKMANNMMDDIVGQVRRQNLAITNAALSMDQTMACFEASYGQYKTKCLSIQQVPEVAQEVRKLLDLCKQGVPFDVIAQAVRDTCG